MKRRHSDSVHGAPTLAHDLVDFPVLLPTNELLVLVGELDLNADLILGSLDKRDLLNYHHSGLNGIVGTIDGESQFVESDISTGVGANV